MEPAALLALLIVAACAAAPDTEPVVLIPKDVTVLSRTLFGVLANNKSIQRSLAKQKVNASDKNRLHFSEIGFEPGSRLTRIEGAALRCARFVRSSSRGR
jgi:hypothetical protein